MLAALIFDQLNVTEAIVLAILLAPTDAALGEAVVTEPRLPSRIRQGLNVESGLNDGICVPLLLIALAAADVEDKSTSGHHAITIVVEEIGYGILGGVAAGLAAAAVVAIAYRRNLISGSWLQVIPVAGAGLAYGIAVALGGSGFIAAFVAGAIFGGLVSQESEQASRLNEELGGLLGGVTFLIFGAVLLGPALKHVSWQIALYAVLSLTLVRMLPVAIAMIGTGARTPTVGFLGWFGPRGLASIVFAVIVVEEAHLPGAETILLTTYLTIGLSVLAHGLTRSATSRALRPLVRIPSARPPSGDGKRPHTRPPHPRSTPFQPRSDGMSTARVDLPHEPPSFRPEDRRHELAHVLRRKRRLRAGTVAAIGRRRCRRARLPDAAHPRWLRHPHYPRDRDADRGRRGHRDVHRNRLLAPVPGRPVRDDHLHTAAEPVP